MPRASGSESILIPGPAGDLEGLWLPPGSSNDGPSVILCHPHPLYGGTMETKLVARTARGLSEAGYQTLRFNFRGVGKSHGAWDQGRGERSDLVSAVDYLVERLPETRLALFGFSFGAALALDVGSGDARIEAVAAVAPPAHLLPEGWSFAAGKPALILGAGSDELVDAEALARWAATLPESVRLRMIPSADHMFTEHLESVTESVVRFFEACLRDEKSA